MADDTESIEIHEDFVVENCMGMVSLALSIFEYIITIRGEVDYFWKRRLTMASAIFLVNRYVVLLYNISRLFNNLTFNQLSCSGFSNSSRVVEILLYLPWAVFSALRVFALSARNCTLSTSVFLLSVVPIGVNLADYHWYEGILIDRVWGCVLNIAEPANVSIRFTVISRGSLILADVIVLAVTWIATYQSTRFAALGGHTVKPSLSLLLLRDGTIYFICLLALNTLHLAYSIRSTFANDQSISAFVNLVEPMNAVLVGRFLLNLQQANVRMLQGGSTTGSLGAPSSLHFDRIVGSLGGSLELSNADEDAGV